MYGRHDDPRNIPDYRSLNRVALTRALEQLRYLDQFHTIDVATHTFVSEAHRERARDQEFFELVEQWLTENAVLHGLRGPLPGHPARGERWAWHVFAGAEKAAPPEPAADE